MSTTCDTSQANAPSASWVPLVGPLRVHLHLDLRRRDAFDRYAAAKVTLFGVSRDSVESHREFAKSHALQFPLVSDEAGAIERAYGVSSALGLSARVTFLVGADGKIAKVWPNVDPAFHADEVLAAAGAR